MQGRAVFSGTESNCFTQSVLNRINTHLNTAVVWREMS
jgi:hypothetical protein